MRSLSSIAEVRGLVPVSESGDEPRTSQKAIKQPPMASFRYTGGDHDHSGVFGIPIGAEGSKSFRNRQLTAFHDLGVRAFRQLRQVASRSPATMSCRGDPKQVYLGDLIGIPFRSMKLIKIGGMKYE